MADVERIKEKLSIVDVVSSYVKLQKAGSLFKARCPFHNEKTPSFIVTPTRGTFYCFGCGAKGDIFTFVERFEGIDFTKTLELLASRAGVPLTMVNPTQVKEKARLLEALEAATNVFEDSLARNVEAREYLKRRGLSDKTISEWRLGFAPNEWEYLRGKLTAHGFSDRELLTSGLARTSEKKKGEYYDYFRGRIIFPLFDAGGRVVAFSGRAFADTEKDGPKYLNSPDTPLFHKNRYLYGFHRAKASIHKLHFSMIVEGQMDLLMAHQAGWANTVAPSGTALTEGQFELVRHLSPNVVLAFDSDAAGLAAATKAAYLALTLKMNPKILASGGGKDPADVILESAELFKQKVKASSHVVDFFLDHHESLKDVDERKWRLTVQGVVLPLVSVIDNRIDQEHFIEKIASRLGLPTEAVRAELVKIKEPLLRTKPALPEVKERGRMERTLRRIAALILMLRGIETPVKDPKELLEEFKRIAGERVHRIFTVPEEELIESEREHLHEIIESPPELMQEIEELLMMLEEEVLREELGELIEHLKAAEEIGEKDKSQELLEQSKALAQKITNLHTRKAAIHG